MAYTVAMAEIPLGKVSGYPEKYAPDVLFPIARAANREALGLTASLPFSGTDLWTAWELTWLRDSGKPAMAAAEIRVPADSPNIIESKSLKLYLNSFAMTRIGDEAELVRTIETDLSERAEAPVTVGLIRDSRVAGLPGRSLDELDVTLDTYDVNPGLLASAGGESVSETWNSALLRSLCPVTSQPDFGSVMVRYEGPRIEPGSLLAYIVSFREHQDFHEACIERMFVDLLERTHVDKLTVYARYQRRGGLDINPYRSNFEASPPVARIWNQ